MADEKKPNEPPGWAWAFALVFLFTLGLAALASVVFTVRCAWEAAG